MATDMKTVVADGGALLRAAANATGAGVAGARDKLDDTIRSAKTRLADVSRPALDSAKSTAAAARDYVNDHPWTLIGIAAAAGAVIGFVVARR